MKKEESNKQTVSRDELLRISQDLCYEHYCEKFEEFITNRDLSDCVVIRPYHRDILKEQFKDFMQYEKFEASVEWIKDYYEKSTISRDELLRISQDLCYEHYCEKIEEFITNRDLSNCVVIQPYYRDRLKEQFRDFIKYEKFEASVELIKKYYKFYYEYYS